MLNNQEIARIMTETGMGELQAYRHLQQREFLRRYQIRTGSRRG